MWTKLFRKRKLQTIMIFFVVLLCTTLLNGAMTILTSLNKPFEQLRQECKPADLVIYMYSGLKEDADIYKAKFEELSNVEKVVESPYVYIDDEMYVGDTKISAYLDLVEYDKEVYRKLRYVDGSTDIEKELANGKCYVPACVKNEYDLKVGDTFTIKSSKGDICYSIAGFIVEPYSTSNAFDANILVGKLPKELTKVQYNIKIFAADGFNGDDVKRAYQDENSGIFPGYIKSINDVVGNSLIAINIVSAAFLTIGIIMLIVSGLIINFMIRHAMISDAKSIAVYKTIGYTTKNILGMYMLFYFIVVTVASVLGVFASKLLASCVLGNLFANLGQPKDINVFYTGWISILAVIVFVLLIVFCVIIKTKNVKPVYALNGLTNSNTKKHRYSGKSGISFSPVAIAFRNIRRDKKGVLGILITIIVTIFAVNFGIISLDVAFLQKENNDYWIGIDASDVVVNITDKDNYKAVEDAISDDDRVLKYYNISQDERILFDWDKYDSTPTVSAFIYDDYTKVDLPIVEGRNPENANEIAIGSLVADEQGKEVGDYIECYIGYKKKVNLLVTGIFQTYYQMGDACRLSSATYTNNDISFNYNMCSIYLKEDVDKDEFIADMSSKLGNKGEVIPRTEAFSSIMNLIVVPQKQGIPPVIVLAFIIGAINIFCIVMLKNAANKKNNEIYKSIGYSTGDLILSNLIYVGVIAIVSVAIAVPLNIATYPSIMQLALSVFGFRAYPMTVMPSHLIIGNVSAIVLFILSTLISSWSLKKIDVRDLVIE